MTKFTATQIAQLTAIITGGGYKRAATRDAAVKRFIKVATEAGIAAPEGFLDMNFDAATTDLHAELNVLKTGRKPEAPTTANKRKAALEVTAKAAPKADKSAKAKADRPDFRDPAKVQEVMLDLIGAFGPGKVGKFRAEWINRDPEGYGRLAPTQQKGIMRKAINKLVATGLVSRDGSTFSIAKKAA